MKCCGSRPAAVKRRPASLAPNRGGGAAAEPLKVRRFRVGQPVEMLGEAAAKAAYAGHEFRNPVTDQSLFDLTWEDKARPRCGSRGTVAEYNNTEDFLFVRFAEPLTAEGAGPPEEESMLAYYSTEEKGREPELAAACYRPAAGELMVPQAFKTLGWGELLAQQQSDLGTLGCGGTTWEGGEYYPARPGCLERSWDELGTEEQEAAAAEVLKVAGLGGKHLLPGASDAWEAWCKQRIDNAGRALGRTGAWAMGEWEALQPAQQAAALCVGMTQTCWSRSAPWLCAEDVSPGLPLRLADVKTLRGACRSHPLWDSKFSHQWPALRNTAGCACSVVAVDLRRSIVSIEWDDDDALDIASNDMGGRSLSSRPQVPFAALETRDPSRPSSMAHMLGYYAATGVFDSVEPDLIDVYGKHQGMEGGFELIIE